MKSIASDDRALSMWLCISAAGHLCAIAMIHFVYLEWSKFEPASPQVIDVSIVETLPELFESSRTEHADAALPEPADERLKRTERPRRESADKVRHETARTANSELPGGTGPEHVEGASLNVSDNKIPPYPESARRARREGTVMLSVTVGADGRVAGVEIATSSGTEALDKSAQSTVLGWSFRPAQLNGSAVASTVLVPIKFELTGR